MYFILINKSLPQAAGVLFSITVMNEGQVCQAPTNHKHEKTRHSQKSPKNFFTPKGTKKKKGRGVGTSLVFFGFEARAPIQKYHLAN